MRRCTGSVWELLRDSCLQEVRICTCLFTLVSDAVSDMEPQTHKDLLSLHRQRETQPEEN